MSSERSPIEDRQLSNESVSSAESVAGTLHLTEHSTYARRKLDELQERHNNKIQVTDWFLICIDEQILNNLSKVT